MVKAAGRDRGRRKGSYDRAATSLLLFVLGLATIVFAFQQAPTDTLLAPSHRVRIEADSLAFFGPNLTSATFWISPSDDLLYTAAGAVHFAPRGSFTPRVNAAGEMLLTFERWRGRDLLVWHVQGQQTAAVRDVIYLVSNRPDGVVQITRELGEMSGSVAAIGQVLRYCDACSITAGDRGAVGIAEAGGDKLVDVSAPEGASLQTFPAEHLIEVTSAVARSPSPRVSQELRFRQA